LCTERADANQIREHAIAGGMMTLRQCGWQSVLDGVTSVDEVMRITAGDDL
jgi:type II secretory ATPase GspE/PulE/Tfp pilus assembly ATPase PilB-like protein